VLTPSAISAVLILRLLQELQSLMFLQIKLQLLSILLIHSKEWISISRSPSRLHFKVTALCATDIFGIAREAAATAPVAAAALKTYVLKFF